MPQHPPTLQLRPAATAEDARDAALQYVRKISGYTKPSQANAEAFQRAVDPSPRRPCACSTSSSRRPRRGTAGVRSSESACASPLGASGGRRTSAASARAQVPARRRAAGPRRPLRPARRPRRTFSCEVSRRSSARSRASFIASRISSMRLCSFTAGPLRLRAAGSSACFEAKPVGDFLIMTWVWLIIVGALVGALGRLFHPGVDPMGWIVTILIGIASLLIAGLIFNGFWAFVLGVIVAVALCALWGRMAGGRGTARAV